MFIMYMEIQWIQWKMFESPIAYIIYKNYWHKSNSSSEGSSYERIQDCPKIDIQTIYDEDYNYYYDRKIKEKNLIN